MKEGVLAAKSQEDGVDDGYHRVGLVRGDGNCIQTLGSYPKFKGR
jgi:hypothetical protein